MAADAVRKLQQEAAAQPERKALQDISADQYERQVGGPAGGVLGVWAPGEQHWWGSGGGVPA